MVEVEEKRTGSLNFGAGFSTVESIVGFAELTQGNFDVTNWPTFTGGGQKFRARVQIGSQRQGFRPFSDRALFPGSPSLARRRAVLPRGQLPQRCVQSAELWVLARGAKAARALHGDQSASTGSRKSTFSMWRRTPHDLIKAEKGARTKSQITTSLEFDTRDNPFLSRKGQRVVLTPFISGGFLGGDDQLVGFDLEASQYFHLPYDLILLLNAEIAGVNTWGDGDRVPISDRLFLGGPNNLRGFDYRDVGPKDENSEPLGGKTLARATVELTVSNH
ncbi:MAG: BamA/TamA family outer membrane protein [Geodermatophilaceae bacterium]